MLTHAGIRHVLALQVAAVLCLLWSVVTEMMRDTGHGGALVTRLRPMLMLCLWRAKRAL